jgi:tetratricopeptide (TPR) repeat protein
MAGRTDDALAAARTAASRAPDNARIRGRVGWVLYHAKRNEDAEREYRALIDAFAEEFGSEETRAALLDVRLMLSNLAVLRGDIAQAEEWLEQILDEYPENISAMNDLGYIWADQSKNLDRALEMIERAVKAEPDNAAYRDSLGWAYFRMGRFDESVSELRKAAEAENPDGVILDHLGDALAAQGKKEEARAAWQKALETLDKAAESQRITEIRRKLESSSEP